MNAVGDHRPDEDWGDMSPPVENTVAQARPQDLGYMGSYDMANHHPPLHGHHDRAVNNYAGVALDVPAQAQVAPLAPVCTCLTLPHTPI